VKTPGWHPSEVQYVLDDSGEVALFSSRDMAGVTGPLDGEREGREMLYSSGTTGRPKGVRKQLPDAPFGDPGSAPVIVTYGITRYGENGVVCLSPAPLYHSAPLVWSVSLHRGGATVVVMEKFDPAHCLALIERHKITHAQSVPTMFTRLLRLPEAERTRYDLSSLRMVTHGAAPCPVDIKKRMMDWWGPIIHEYYAGTEDTGGAPSATSATWTPTGTCTSPTGRPTRSSPAA
jgi:acyl-CoA synthetase (AMP-forming)/AMP-acid ligase II